MTHPILNVRCLRNWQGHESSYTAGDVVQVPDFLARLLVKSGHAEILDAPVVPVLQVERQERLW